MTKKKLLDVDLQIKDVTTHEYVNKKGEQIRYKIVLRSETFTVTFAGSNSLLRRFEKNCFVRVRIEVAQSSLEDFVTEDKEK